MLIEIDGCVFDRDQLECSHGFEELDAVGRESFVNHIHLEGADHLTRARAIIESWAAELQRRCRNGRFRIYLQSEPDETIIRFHRVRDGVPNWAESGIEIIEVGN